MSNMSDYRFQNTLKDLKDCKEALDNDIIYVPIALSPEEDHAKDDLIELCHEIARKYGD